MAPTNLERFINGMNRIMGGIPGMAARENTRVADNKDIEAVPGNVLNQEVPWYGFDGKVQPKGARSTVTMAGFLGWFDSGLHVISRGLGEIKGSVDALTLAVAELTKKQGIDQEALNKAMQQAVTSAEGSYEFRKVEE